MSDISGQLIKDSYSYILQADTSTGYVYRVNGNVPINPIFSSGLTIFSAFTFVDGNQSNGYVLTSDGSGNSRWAAVSGASVSSVTAGSGLSGNSTTGAITLINTSPDKTVVITGGTNIQIISNYPNFGINFTGTTSSSGAYLPLSGGTVTGATIFQSGLTANTISGGTIYGNGANLTNVVNSITASTGLSGNSTTGTITIINTAPDQTVTISGGTGISTGGTYPNFTITNSAPDKTVTITGGTNIQVTGTYPDFGVSFTGQTSFPYLPLSGGTVTGGTIFNSGLTANTLTITGLTSSTDSNVVTVDGSGILHTYPLSGLTGNTVSGNDGASSGRWTLDNTTDPPTANYFYTTATDFTGITSIDISSTANTNTDYYNWLSTAAAQINNGYNVYLEIQEVGNNSNLGVYLLTSVFGNTSYFTFDMYNVSGGGSLINGGNYTISYVWNGINGSPGTPGVSGTSFVDGIENAPFNDKVGVMDAAVRSLKTLKNQGVLVAGDFTTFNGNSRNGFVKLNPDGSEDVAFYTNFSTVINTITTLLATNEQEDGKILVGGVFGDNIYRFNPDGTEDTTFSTNIPHFGGVVYSITIQPDGKILVGGDFSKGIIRLNSDGTEDTTFTSNIGAGFNGICLTISLQTDGKIIVGGTFSNFRGNNYNKLARLTPDGFDDNTFNANLGSGFDNSVYTTSIQTDGKIIVGGLFNSFNSDSGIQKVVRLNTDGSVDTLFTANISASGGFNESIFTSLIQNDGKILLGGIFTSFNSNTRNYFVRLYQNGTDDITFNNTIGSGLSGVGVITLATQNLGRIIVGGQFNTFNTITRYDLVNLFNPSNIIGNTGIDGTDGSNTRRFMWDGIKSLVTSSGTFTNEGSDNLEFTNSYLHFSYDYDYYGNPVSTWFDIAQSWTDTHGGSKIILQLTKVGDNSIIGQYFGVSYITPSSATDVVVKLDLGSYQATNYTLQVGEIYAFSWVLLGADASVSVTSVTAGSGLSGNTTTGDITIVNTEPDKTVVITGGTNIQIVSNYPNFGINFTGTTSSAFTGGTVSGATNFTNGLTANTISATTYYNLPSQSGTGVSAFSYNQSTGLLTITKNDTNTLTAGTFSYVTATTLSAANVLSVASNGASATTTTINAVTGGTYSNGTITLSGTGNFSSTITGFPNSFPYLPLSGGTVSGATNFISGLTANTISATTYFNLPTDIRVTGGTYTNGTATFTNNTGGTFNVTGFAIGGGGGQIFYLNLSQSQNGNRFLSTTASTASEQTSGVTIGSSVTGSIASFQTTPLNISLIPGGIWSFYLHSYKQDNNSSFNIFVEVYKITSGGSQTLLFATDPAPVTTNSPNPSMQLTDGYFSGTSLNISDGVVAVVKATNTSNQSHTITLVTEGSQHYSYVVSTIPTQQGLTCETLSGCSIIQTINTDISNKFDKSGGTVSGATNFISGLTANTISATTYSNLPSQSGTGVSAFSYNQSTGILTITKNDTNTLTAGTFSYVTATTLSAANVLSVASNGTSATTTTINAVTGGTYSNGTITLSGTGSVNGNTITGFPTSLTGAYLPLSGGTVTGDTIFQSGVTANTVFAGSGSISSSAVMESSSTTKGFLPPRMTEAQRIAITSPATGLMVYQTDGDEGLYINKSFGWIQII